MPITHHPDDATLMSYACGSLPEAHAAVVSTHLMSCETCRQTVRDLEFVGAALVADLPEVSLDRARPCISDLAYAEAGQCDVGQVDGPSVDDASDPVARLTGYRLEDIPWKRLGWGVWHYPIKTPNLRAGDLRLIKVQNGQAMPEHGHGGSELTLVLDGSYTDEFGRFSVGDVADLDDSVEHRPMADAKTGCICLIASDSKARFTGVIGRLVQPFAGL